MSNKKWRFREDMLGHYINNVSSKTFQDAEDRLNFLEGKENNTNKYIKALEKRLEGYENSLVLTDRFFNFDMENNFESSNFEKNLINTLLIPRIELKERIDELKYVIQLLSMEVPEEE